MNETPARIPLIGEPAPSFTAETTQGEINFPSDYKGQWVIFFSPWKSHAPLACYIRSLATPRRYVP